ncbi:5-hydroxytryptamine receptor 4-like [Acanthaster planci]|uniref:5-hydroxytryptamine receptor 4-like n=1 Tax=Acanthaster planci TaxID=133434 RepID=A0A8B7Z258_ACAPL|nr:5-hydroxytryptamine receptor 4-like [Acanthaster planci]
MVTFGNGTDSRSMAFVAIQSSFMAIIMLSATLGNTLVLLALANYRILRNNTTVFIANLAVADLSVGLTGMPFILGSSIANRWIAGDVFCTVNGITNVIFCVASMLTLAGIALDRYFAIVHPFRYLELMSGRRVAVVLAWVWLQPLALALLPFAWSWSYYKYFHNEYICTIDWGYSPSFSCSIFALGFFAPLTIMFFCYFHILRVARRQSRLIVDMESMGSSESALATRRARRLKRDAKAAFMLLVLIGNFMACWLPHFVGILCLVFTRNDCPFSDAVFTTTTWLAMANSGLNPVIYGLLDGRIRQAVGLILRCRMRERLKDPSIVTINTN